MNNAFNSTKVPLPPAFMATTRQKILLAKQGITGSSFSGKHTSAISALNTIGNITKGILAHAVKNG
ncbi:MAG: hypothetical protein LUB59_07320 [Candidatus Gastranaerophilales bacterium]|nr:hypothetical protein [Candidatus Gastranaerophilales bacterium]